MGKKMISNIVVRRKRQEANREQRAHIKDYTKPKDEREDIILEISKTKGVIKRCENDLIKFKDSVGIQNKIKSYKEMLDKLNNKLKEHDKDTTIEK